MKPPLSVSSPFTDLPNADDWPAERHVTVIRPNRPDDIRRRCLAIITPASCSSFDTQNHSSRCVHTSLVFFRSHSRTMSHSVFTVPRSPPFPKLHLGGRRAGQGRKGFHLGRAGRGPKYRYSLTPFSRFLPAFCSVDPSQFQAVLTRGSKGS